MKIRLGTHGKQTGLGPVKEKYISRANTVAMSLRRVSCHIWRNKSNFHQGAVHLFLVMKWPVQQQRSQGPSAMKPV